MPLIDILIYSIVGQCTFFTHLFFFFFNLPPGSFDLNGMIVFISARSSLCIALLFLSAFHSLSSHLFRIYFIVGSRLVYVLYFPFSSLTITNYQSMLVLSTLPLTGLIFFAVAHFIFFNLSPCYFCVSFLGFYHLVFIMSTAYQLLRK